MYNMEVSNQTSDYGKMDFQLSSIFDRVSMKLANAKEKILHPLEDCSRIRLEKLQESGLSREERRYVMNWFRGNMSGRACLFALAARRCDLEAEIGIINNNGDLKNVFSLNDSTGLDNVSLLSSTLNLPDALLTHDKGYLYRRCFSMAPSVNLRKIIDMIRSRTVGQSVSALSEEQLRLALEQLRLDFLSAEDDDAADWGDAAEGARAGSAGKPPLRETQRREERQLHYQVCIELLRAHISTVSAADARPDDASASGETASDVQEVSVSSLLRQLKKPMQEVVAEAMATPVGDLESSNATLKPYVLRLNSLKKHLSVQVEDLQRYEAYYTLGVREDSSIAEIKKAYHKLSRKCHPDRKGGSKKDFQRLQEAYQEVLNRRQKSAPDESLSGVAEEQTGGGGKASTGDNPETEEMSSDVNETGSDSTDPLNAEAAAAAAAAPRREQGGRNKGNADAESIFSQVDDDLDLNSASILHECDEPKSQARNPQSRPASRDADEDLRGDNSPMTGAIYEDQSIPSILKAAEKHLRTIQDASKECASLAQLAMHWQHQLDRSAGFEPALSFDEDPQDSRLPTREALQEVLSLVFSAASPSTLSDNTGLVSDELNEKAQKCRPILVTHPLERLCSGLQQAASTAMRLPNSDKDHGIACARDESYIAAVEDCMSKALSIMKGASTLVSVDSQLNSTIKRVRESREFRQLNSSYSSRDGAEARQARLQRRLHRLLAARAKREQDAREETQKRRRERRSRREVRILLKKMEKKVRMESAIRTARRSLRNASEGTKNRIKAKARQLYDKDVGVETGSQMHGDQKLARYERFRENFDYYSNVGFSSNSAAKVSFDASFGNSHGLLSQKYAGDDSDDSESDPELASDMAEVDAILSRIESSSPYRAPGAPTSLAPRPTATVIETDDESDSYMRYTSNYYFNNVDDSDEGSDSFMNRTENYYSDGDSDGDGDDDDDSSNSSGLCGSTESDDDIIDLSDISVSDDGSSTSSDESVQVGDTGLDAVFNNLSESSDDDEDQSDVGRESGVPEAAWMSEESTSRRFNDGFLLDMLTTCYRQAARAMNIMAKEAISAAGTASDTVTLMENIIQRVKLQADENARENEKTAADDEENGFSEEDKEALNEMRRQKHKEEVELQQKQQQEEQEQEEARTAEEERIDEAAVEAELDEEGVQGFRREEMRQSKMESRRTDRELRGLKEKIRKLQVQLRVQHVKSLQAANDDVRKMQNRLQKIFLRTHAKTSSHKNTAVLTLLADLMDSSVADLRGVDFSRHDAWSQVVGCLDWMLALRPHIDLQEREETSHSGPSRLAETLEIPLAMPPDVRTRVLWLAALLAPDALSCLTGELQQKLAFLDAYSTINEAAVSFFDEPGRARERGASAGFSRSFCASVAYGVANILRE